MFKRDAVRLVSEEGYTFEAAAAAVNVSEQSLRVWSTKLVPAAPPCGEDATPSVRVRFGGVACDALFFIAVDAAALPLVLPDRNELPFLVAMIGGALIGLAVHFLATRGMPRPNFSLQTWLTAIAGTFCP